jgi:hypothetical protein
MIVTFCQAVHRGANARIFLKIFLFGCLLNLPAALPPAGRRGGAGVAVFPDSVAVKPMTGLLA